MNFSKQMIQNFVARLSGLHNCLEFQHHLSFISRYENKYVFSIA